MVAAIVTAQILPSSKFLLMYPSIFTGLKTTKLKGGIIDRQTNQYIYTIYIHLVE